MNLVSNLHLRWLSTLLSKLISQLGEYIFHVRRRFDWEGKYSDTVVDIKSKVLKEVRK